MRKSLWIALGIVSTLAAPPRSLSQTAINGSYDSGDTMKSTRKSNPSIKVNCADVSGTDSSRRYLDTTDGSDSNDGCSLGRAKSTISAACASLPSGNPSCTSGAGTIIANPGSTAALPAGTIPTITLVLQTQDGEATSGPIPWIDGRTFGMRQLVSPFKTIAVTTNGTSTVLTKGLSDFQENDGIVVPAAGRPTTQTRPSSAPTLQVVGATGSSSVSYECVGIDTMWGKTAASPAGMTSAVPTVFGWAAVAISSAAWSSNTVTITASSPFRVASGKYHVMVAHLSSGSTNLGGIRYVTVTSATTLTYSVPGSGAVTVNGDSNLLFVNGYILTQVSESAGSNQIVLTADANHNFQQQLAGSHPTKIFLDGIYFPGETQVAYADGLFTITSVTANTITITTQYTATLTENASANATYATSKVAQMTALVWPEVIVTCPENARTGVPSTGGAYYAVYADYGSGYAPIGFTPWQHSILIDYGPAFTKSGFTASPAMSLPSTPPGAPQMQVFEAQIKTARGTTLTLDRNVPQSLSDVTAYHSNGTALQNAVNMSCQRSDGFSNNHFVPVYLPPANGSGYYYLFNAPIDLYRGANNCNRANILDGAPVWINGTIMDSNAAFVKWDQPQSLGGFDTVPAGATAADVEVVGYADPMFGGLAGTTWNIKGMAFETLSNGQNAVVLMGEEDRLEKDSFGALSGNLLSSIPVVLTGGYETELKDVAFGSIPNISAPLPPVCGNCGQVMYWPVPTFDMISGPGDPPSIRLEGTNYGSGTGFEWDNLYPGLNTPAFFWEFNDVETFQEPWQPFLTLEGNAQLGSLKVEKVQMDSVQMPVVANLYPGNVGNAIFRMAYNANAVYDPKMTGYAFGSVTEWAEISGENPVQSTNDLMTGPSGVQSSMPFYPSVFGQNHSSSFAGSCMMSSGVTCSKKATATFKSTPLCFATDTATSDMISAVCSDSSGTVTVTAASSSSHTFNFLLVGNPN